MSVPIDSRIEGSSVMIKRLLFLVFLVSVVAAPAFAQPPKAEVGVIVGWVFSDGVSGDNFRAGDGNVYNRVDPKDSFGWGIDIGVFVGPNAEVGFIYTDQPTMLQVSGTNTKDVGDQSTRTYHGYGAYNWGEADAKVRPYFMFGLGMTSYSDVTYTPVAGTARTISGVSRFSTTWGVGAKVYGNGHVGGRVGLHWTPTYIKSDAAGYWCDPYWGCYLVGSAQYANQFSLNGGVTLRF
jgi:Outer membrane protein beta-barrel domain